MPTEEEIKRITELYDLGYSQGQIAKELGKGKSTINRWLQSLGISNGTDAERAGTKKATEARAIYDRARRLKLNDLWFEKIEKMLIEAKDANTLRALAIPYGVAEDKRQLLEPLQPDNAKSGLEEIREKLRIRNDLGTSTEGQQSG